MTVTTRFGTFEADERDVVDMATPLAGFESCRRYLLLSAPNLAPFACLHGLDDPAPSFLVLDPRFVDAGYPCELDAGEYERVGASPDEALLWLGIVTVDSHGATINLRAPVAINPKRMIGVQSIPPNSVYRIDHPLPVR